jgi:DivIVA domain-containing protein
VAAGRTGGKDQRVVNLTPDEIERRTFSIEARGYDRDEVRKFLFEVAARLRLAFHTTQPPISYPIRRPIEPALPPASDSATTATGTAATPDTKGIVPAAPSDRPASKSAAAKAEQTGSPRPGDGTSADAGDDLATPLGDPLAALAGTSDFGGNPPISAKAGLADRAEAESKQAAAAIDAIAAIDPNEGYERLGTAVAAVLRATQDAVTTRREQAEAIATSIKAEADADAAEIRRQAEADAVWQHDRAKRVLITAKEQADAIIAEAESQAKAMIMSAREQAEQHTQHVAAQARRHAETILRAEREALRRLHEAKSGLTTAIDVIGAAESRPVVDLTDFRPHVRLGEASVAMPLDADDLGAQDPLVRMVRHAVHRAVDGAAEHADADADEATTDPTTDATDQADADDEPRAASETDEHAADRPAIV